MTFSEIEAVKNRLAEFAVNGEGEVARDDVSYFFLYVAYLEQELKKRQEQTN